MTDQEFWETLMERKSKGVHAARLRDDNRPDQGAGRAAR